MRFPRIKMRRPKTGVFAVITTIEGKRHNTATAAERAALISPDSKVGKTRWSRVGPDGIEPPHSPSSPERSTN
jgi:hypothetical protein